MSKRALSKTVIVEVGAFVILLITIALVLSGCGSAVGEENSTQRIGKVDTALPDGIDITHSSPTVLPPTITPFPTETPTPIPDLLVSVLMGGDFDQARPERNKYGIRSDVFVIAFVDVYDYLANDGLMAINLVSVPRDLWVEVPCTSKSSGYDRVNAAWAWGGFDCVEETVKLNFIPEGVNYKLAPFAYVEFDGFIELIDYMGGIDITPPVTHTEWCGDYHGTDGATGRWIKWRAGETYHMMGGQALCYARGRMHPEGDLDRNRRGLELLWAMVEQYPDQLFESDSLADILTGIVDFWWFAKDHVQSNWDISDIGLFLEYVANIDQSEWRSIKFTLDEVEYWTDPEFGASVLRSKIDIPKWIYCKLFLEGWSFDDKYCTETFKLED